VLGVWVTVLIVGVTLLVLLWGGGTFVQAYFYTEPSSGMFWQAPAAAASLTLFYALWCLLDYGTTSPRSPDLPYDTIFRFSNLDKKGTEAARRLSAVLKDGTRIPYTRYGEIYHRELSGGGQGEKWPFGKAVAIEILEEGETVRYALTPSEQQEYRAFVSPDGWTIKEYSTGPTGRPEAYRSGLWLANMLLNGFHFGLWFVCLWLLMRFQLGHALGLAFVMWLLMTLLVVPMMLARAGDAGREAAGPQRQTLRIEDRRTCGAGFAPAGWAVSPC
jgi:hypothetical protein